MIENSSKVKARKGAFAKKCKSEKLPLSWEVLQAGVSGQRLLLFSLLWFFISPRQLFLCWASKLSAAFYQRQLFQAFDGPSLKAVISALLSSPPLSGHPDCH
jgi:hypothetical protein